MSIVTIADTELTPELMYNYFGALVNQFFKILPMRENKEESLPIYMESLRDELLGCRGLIVMLEHDASFLTLVSILQFLIDNQECPLGTTKREVFKAISICNKLRSRFSKGGD